jgi:Zn-dependent M28 family amino/carboxypeptidase
VLGSPGANDNAAGVAALIEMAHLLREKPTARGVAGLTKALIDLADPEAEL